MQKSYYFESQKCFFTEKLENITIEERVSLLEIEMEEVQGEVVEVQDEVIILFSQQVIQDDRLGNLEEDTDQLEIDVEGKSEFLHIFFLILSKNKGSSITKLLQK